MAIVCNNIIPQLVVTMPSTCAQFTESQSYSANCGAGVATDSCAIAISGGQPPYSTSFSYPVVPTATNCTLNMSAFPGGSGINPQFGYSFSGSNMCSLGISGTLRVNYVVTDASGQTVTGSRQYTISISRFVTSSGGGGGGGCVTLDSFIKGYGIAANVRENDSLEVVDPVTFESRRGLVSLSNVMVQPCVRITTINGAVLECSTTAPIAVEGGADVLAGELTGLRVPILRGQEWNYEEVISVDCIGEKEVMYITCENTFFLAGSDENAYFLHHNAKNADLDMGL